MLPSYHRNAQQIRCKGQERKGWEDKERKRGRKGRNTEVSEHSHGYSHLQKWGSLSKCQRVPQQCEEASLQQQGSRTVLGRIPARLHTHSSSGEESSPKQWPQNPRWKITMPPLGQLLLILLESLQFGPREEQWLGWWEGRSMERSPKSFICARGTGLLSMLSDFFHPRQFNFKGTAALKSLPDNAAAMGWDAKNPRKLRLLYWNKKNLRLFFTRMKFSRQELTKYHCSWTRLSITGGS